MAHLQDRVPLQQVNDEEQQARELLAQAGYVGMVGKNTYSKTQGVCPSPSISLHSFFFNVHLQSSGCSNYLDLRVRKAVPYLGYGMQSQSPMIDQSVF